MTSHKYGVLHTYLIVASSVHNVALHRKKAPEDHSIGALAPHCLALGDLTDLDGMACHVNCGDNNSI
jgi:hypothetical protein